MLDKKPIFRADHVGSLLRPQAVKDARKACLEDATIDSAALAQIEDHSDPAGLREQEAALRRAVNRIQVAEKSL